MLNTLYLFCANNLRSSETLIISTWGYRVSVPTDNRWDISPWRGMFLWYISECISITGTDTNPVSQLARFSPIQCRFNFIESARHFTLRDDPHRTTLSPKPIPCMDKLKATVMGKYVLPRTVREFGLMPPVMVQFHHGLILVLQSQTIWLQKTKKYNLVKKCT